MMKKSPELMARGREMFRLEQLEKLPAKSQNTRCQTADKPR